MLFIALRHAFTPFLSLLYPYNRIEIYRLFAIHFCLFYGYFALNHVLFLVFFHAFSLLRLSASRLAWLEIRLVLSAFYHPTTEFFTL